MNNKAVCLFQTALIASINVANQLKNNYLQNSRFSPCRVWRHRGSGGWAVSAPAAKHFGGSRFLQSGHYTR